MGTKTQGATLTTWNLIFFGDSIFLKGPRKLDSKPMKTNLLHPSDGEGDEGGVDLHSGEFCVDVSTFGDIVFENQGREACDTTFEKVCETKTEQVSQVESH